MGNQFDDIVGKKFTIKCDGVKDKQGFWKVTSTIIDEISEDGENWESKDVAIMVIEKDFLRAYTKGMAALGAYLESVEYDLFNEEKYPNESTKNLQD